MNMTRITKDRQERRQELIEASKRLFLQRGYDQTAVYDIVKEVNVAQGTFYYHFASKADLLEAVVESRFGGLEDEVRDVASDPREDDAQKVNDIINQMLQSFTANREILEFIHQDGNMVLHERLMKTAFDLLVPLLAQTLAAGAQKERFDVSHPEETAEFLVAAIAYLFHQPDLVDPKRLESMRATLELVLTRVLGVQDDQFHLKV
ncbi:MAG: TetR/AcrR family transcriptional regulator [Methanosarcinales archaeon]|nr:TetR/AcrR family transcriptional regulator [Methanosarcinales archaeon]